ncbi:MAG TPA: hypothetical protein VMT95_04320 [Candidatus Binatia bacterium]|nr:hypothetical protein [Candidatus Binatia bacterium]
MELRPLGFGEIFDRAITLYIRNFVPFAAIVAVLIVPTAVMGYFVDLAQQPEFDAFWHMLQHPGSTPTEPIPTIFNSPAILIAVVAMLLFTYSVWPFALNAVAVGVAHLYRNLPIAFRACYEVALRRWSQTIGMILVDLLVLVAWYVAAVLLIVAVVFVAAAMGAVAPQAGFAFGLVAGFIGVVLLLPTLAPLFVALNFSMYAVVIEDRGVMESLYLGFQRVFNRREFWRAILFAIAAGATMIAGNSLFGLFGIFFALLHLPAVEALVQAVGNLVLTPFGVVLMAVYYFDVRIRREAFDLEASLEGMTAAQPA